MTREAVESGARRHKACDILGISVRTLQRWEREPEKEDQRAGPNSRPGNSLSEAEKMLVVAVATSPCFRDLSPSQIVPILADSGVYIAFGEGQGMMNDVLMDVHGAGCQRSDPKNGDQSQYPDFFGPQGDVRYVFNYVRCVRTIE